MPQTDPSKMSKKSHVKSNIKQNKSKSTKQSEKTVQRNHKIRPNPSKVKTKFPNVNIPTEASALNLVDEQMTVLMDGGTPLDACNLYDSVVKQEFQARNLQCLANTPMDPEPFLVPVADPQSGCLLDRHVEPHRLIFFLVDYMNRFYDLSGDQDPYSTARQELENNFLYKMTYLMPVLCKQLVEVVAKESLIVTTKPDVVVFGDVHGNFNDLWYIYNHFINHADYEQHRFVFLGDYVDRGSKPIEIVSLLFALKLAFPDRFFILRGNHEVMKVNRKYGFQTLCEHLFGENFITHRVNGPLIYKSVNRVFTYLPVGVVVKGGGDHSVFCCHGGVPNQKLKPETSKQSAWTVEELNAFTATMKPSLLVPSRRAPPAHLALNEILWNDPLPERARSKPKFQTKLFFKNKKRGGHCSFFTEKGLRAFLEVNHLSTVVRGHQYRHCTSTGFRYDFGTALLTVFSSSNYCGTEHNTTGFAMITGPNCTVKPHVLRTEQETAQYHNFNFFGLVVDPRTKQVIDVLY